MQPFILLLYTIRMKLKADGFSDSHSHSDIVVLAVSAQSIEIAYKPYLKRIYDLINIQLDYATDVFTRI